jgi:hypothetical protein
MAAARKAHNLKIMYIDSDDDEETEAAKRKARGLKIMYVH